MSFDKKKKMKSGSVAEVYTTKIFHSSFLMKLDVY